jgi:hypothetical protein
MNGEQPAEAEKPPLDAAEGASASSISNGADTPTKKRKKDALKPIITTEDSPQQPVADAQEDNEDKQDKSGCV